MATPDAAASPAVEESVEELYEEAPCGFLSTLADGTIVKVNRTFLEWTGYRTEDLVGRKRFYDLLTAGGRIYYETHYAPLLHMQGTVREIAVDVKRADGTKLQALVNSVVKRGAGDAPDLIRTTIFDATSRRSYERELLDAKQRAERSESRARLLARTLQQSLIPPSLPHIEGLDIGAGYRAAGGGDEVGGDFYDVFEVGRGGWAVVVGDVVGKGAEAARITALARYTIRAAAMRTARSKMVLATLNQALQSEKAETFCTVAYGRVRRSGRGEWRVTVASGGHPLPYLVPAGGPPRQVGRPGSLLGVLDDAVLHDVTIPLQPGDSVAFYTDGVTEARRGDDFFGEDRLAASLDRLRGETASALAEGIVDEVVAFQDARPRDDIAVVVLAIPDIP